MSRIIGMDEAGYGPNLGPLVITTTVWNVPGSDFDFWETFAGLLAEPKTRDASRIAVGDSKAIYSPTTGIGRLEKSVHVFAELARKQTTSFNTLWDGLTAGASTANRDGIPWYENSDLALPLKANRDECCAIADRWRDVLESTGVQLQEVRSDIVTPGRFNELTERFDSKGLALSHLSLRLLRSVWNPDDDEPTLVIADKHGGRNRYDALLNEVLEGPMAFRLEEGRARSRYRLGNSEVRFQMKAESHFPVALASMFAKYVRELAMEQFNRFWQEQLPGVKPTKGYPVDAKRFRAEIAERQAALGIEDAVLWRER